MHSTSAIARRAANCRSVYGNHRMMPLPTHLQGLVVPLDDSPNEDPLEANVRCTCGSESFELLYPGATTPHNAAKSRRSGPAGDQELLRTRQDFSSSERSFGWTSLCSLHGPRTSSSRARSSPIFHLTPWEQTPEIASSVHRQRRLFGPS